ncbi:MAG: DUF1015 domain-containing protein [Clostridia bacterium]|nr:DUF1015 domain-containing protein [Clostridia bacterium]
MKKPLFTAADIFLPDFSQIDGEKYACIACDQFTSEPKYWQKVEDLVGSAPSLYRIILPECYLESEREEALSARIADIRKHMVAYREGLFTCHKDCMIYVKRTDTAGNIRRGLVGKIDLEAYCYEKGSRSPVRATEGTVLSRIPPRLRVRRGAPLEAPHVMILIDDKDDTLFSALERAEKKTAYKFPLMLGGGHIEGYFLSEEDIAKAEDILLQMEEGAPLPYAVGDGNHSLATAKAYYEEIKQALGEERALSHPARYALAEIVNIHDSSLEFEPIYRVLFNVNPALLLEEMNAFAQAQTGEKEQEVTLLFGKQDGIEEERFVFPHSAHSLTVGTLQAFLDGFLQRYPEAKLDYIHGEDSVRALCRENGAIGFLFDGMKKEELFSSVDKDGSLPRKTFSMGTSRDKRYYLECRSIAPLGEGAQC